MSFFKNNPDFKIYYSDTDSIFINKPLPDWGSSLGQMKLEHVIYKAVFLAPKVYGFITTDGKEVIKVKGLTKEIVSNLHFNDLLIESLLIKDGKCDDENRTLLQINLSDKDLKNKNRTLIFKDSYLTLPASLRNLCTAFDITTSKGYFPFNLNDIYYLGAFPNYEYFTDITKMEYNTLKQSHGKRMWSFNQESIKYCEIDCVSLHQVMTKFNELFYDKYKINVHKSLTGPSLTLRLYKTHNMKPDTIYQLLGKVEYDIRQSYSGGAVDVYIPHNIKEPVLTRNINGPVLTKTLKGKYVVLYYYDVNSLYPYIMANTVMPIGKPIVFTGDIRKMKPGACLRLISDLPCLSLLKQKICRP